VHNVAASRERKGVVVNSNIVGAEVISDIIVEPAWHYASEVRAGQILRNENVERTGR
jgi:uncharacterized protein YcgI (DUF1989 family)